MKNIFLQFLVGYKTFISPMFDGIFGKGYICRYSPTCSVYMYDAIKKHGVIKGGVMGFRRVLSCHRWAKGGYDPVI